jgi:hypothetical protein
MLFHPGRILATPGALQLTKEGVDLLVYLKRHITGDWGDLDEHDNAEERLLCSKRFTRSFCLQHTTRQALDNH